MNLLNIVNIITRIRIRPVSVASKNTSPPPITAGDQFYLSNKGEIKGNIGLISAAGHFHMEGIFICAENALGILNQIIFQII